jgi:hypothetical protein
MSELTCPHCEGTDWVPVVRLFLDVGVGRPPRLLALDGNDTITHHPTTLGTCSPPPERRTKVGGVGRWAASAALLTGRRRRAGVAGFADAV